jgi:DNA-binding NtrC family response regulator
MDKHLPLILIIDDLFGRHLPDGTNEDRDNLCASFQLKDVTEGNKSRQKIKQPIAEAQFYRGQVVISNNGKLWVENDLPGTLEFIRRGWTGNGPDVKRWSLILLDLCFYTGPITGKLNPAVAGNSGQTAESGMPEGRAEDIDPSRFFGLQILRAIHAEFPDLPVVILSSQERGKVSQEFSAHGAMAFLPRANDGRGDELLRMYLDRHGLMPDPHGMIVGRSLPVLKALRAARRTAYNRAGENILIRGERGVGKEEYSRFIHRIHPQRATKALIPVNSAVLTSELYASELFGIERRKATGVDKHVGAVQRANGGDLFFDEIKDMIPQAQAGILRFLEEGTFTPTGGKDVVDVDVRVISATNADVESLAANGRFREDLLDRLRGGGTIVLPPLRERKDDIPLLAQTFVRQAESRRGGKFSRQFSDEAIACLTADDWPGNIRVLRDVLYKVVNDNDIEYIYAAQIEKAKQDLGIFSQRVNVAAAFPENAASDTVASTLAVARIPEIAALSHEVNKVPHSPNTENRNPVDDEHDAGSGEDHQGPASLSDLVKLIDEFSFDLTEIDELRGRLDELDEAAARLVVNYLLASLEITRDPVSGELVMTKAVQFLTGRKKLTTSSAADIIKRLLKRHKSAFDTALENPILRQAFAQAEALRPTNRTKETTKNKT